MTEKAIEDLTEDYGRYHAIVLCFRKKGMEDGAQCFLRLMEVIESIACDYEFEEDLTEMKNLVSYEHTKSWDARMAAKAGMGN